jgi:hypothetical protein
MSLASRTLSRSVLQHLAVRLGSHQHAQSQNPSTTIMNMPKGKKSASYPHPQQGGQVDQDLSRLRVYHRSWTSQQHTHKSPSTTGCSGSRFLTFGYTIPLALLGTTQIDEVPQRAAIIRRWHLARCIEMIVAIIVQLHMCKEEQRTLADYNTKDTLVRLQRR